MRKNPSWLARLAQSAEFGAETPVLQPLVEICGDNRLLIENHLGVTEYGCERIGVRVRYGCVLVTGSELRLCHMSAQQLLIRGKIGCVSLSREG